MPKKATPSNRKFVLWTICPATLLAACICWGAAGAAAQFNRETPVVKAVRRVSPAVVNISCQYEIRKRSDPFSGFNMDPAFESFFRDFFDPGYERREQRTSLGSGVIIDGQRGLILTNAHVVEKRARIRVTLKDERELDAQIVGADPDSDLALLKISSPSELPAIEMGDSDDIMIGETVIAIGNPFGFSHTVTTGVVSALNRSIQHEDQIYRDFIQIDASINPGNSGGPLLNINGDLIGINTAIYAKAQGIGFAIPINKAKRIVADLIQYGEVVQAWIGLSVQDLDAHLAQYLDLDRSSGGLLVTRIEADGPAEKAGLKESDVLLSMGHQKFKSTADYQAYIRSVSAGQSIPTVILRQKKIISLNIKTAKYPMDQAPLLAYRLLGIRVKNISPSKVLPYPNGSPGGVVISVIRKDCYLANIGVENGDIVRQINELSIASVEEFNSAVVKNRLKTSLVVLLQHAGQLYYITVKL
jgi:serine protease Do